MPWVLFCMRAGRRDGAVVNGLRRLDTSSGPFRSLERSSTAGWCARRVCGGRPARRPTTEGAEQPEFGGSRASSGFFLVGGWCSACASSERRRIRFTVSPEVHDVGVVEQPVQRRRRRHHWHPAESFPGEHSFRALVRVGARERHRVRNRANGPASRQNLARRRGAPACVISTRAGVMLEDCQLTVRLPPVHGGGRRELARRPRVYGLDTRLVCHLRGLDASAPGGPGAALGEPGAQRTADRRSRSGWTGSGRRHGGEDFSRCLRPEAQARFRDACPDGPTCSAARS